MGWFFCLGADANRVMPYEMYPRQAYEIWHDKVGPDQPVADTPWHRLLEAHLDLSRDLSGKRVLEIGCGRGGFTCWLNRNSPQPPPNIAAVDYALTAVKRARSLARALGCAHITWEVGDIQAMAHRTASFDTVISCVGSSRVDLQACKLEYSIVSPK